MGRTVMSRAVAGQLALALLLLLAVTSVPVSAQVPGQNVNMISVDKYLQKQNEVDLAISPRNFCHIIGVANDYRTVNNRDLNTDGEIGDSWIGFYVSTDCGETWLNYIMPGYAPTDPYYQGFTAAADPNARFGPGGGLYVSHIQFNKDSNWGRLAVARYLDYNNVEGVPAPATTAEDQSDLHASPVGFLGFTEVARGSAGQFLDKPSIAVSPGRKGECVVPGGTIPSTNVYVAWTEFLSNSSMVARSRVNFARSTNCGKGFDPAIKLSEGYPLGQGTAIAVHPTNPKIIYVAWRQVKIDKYADAIMIARSSDGGATFSKPQPVTDRKFVPFDQPTTSTTFRTTGYPTIVMDESGRLYLAYASRVGPETEGFMPTDDPAGGAPVKLPTARILVTSTLDGVKWEGPALVDVVGASEAGHQFMPALAYAGGQLNLTWYDLRYDESKALTPYADEKDVINIPDASRHTLDIRAAQAEAGVPLRFTVYGVSDIIDAKRKVSLYDAQKRADPSPPGKQLNFNRGNLKLYSGGTKPFMGDYIGTAGVQWLPDGQGGWTFNGRNADRSNTVLRTFQTAWADNRDALVGFDQSQTNPDLAYVKPFTDSTMSCGVDEYKKMNSRNANVYTSRITPGLYLSALGNTKPTHEIERAFAINLENGTDIPLTVDLSIESGVPASFTQPSSNDVRNLTVTIEKFSSTARTVYIGPTPGVSYPPVRITATDGGIHRAEILLNGDPNNPLILQPSNTSVPIGGSDPKDTHNPRVQAPRVQAPRVQAPRVQAPRVQAPRVQAVQVEEPRVQAPRVQAEPVEAPRVQAPRVQAAPFSDISYEVTNIGNTTSAFDLNVSTSVPTSGYEFQLIAWRPYLLPFVGPDCLLQYTEVPQVFFDQPLALGDLGFDGLPPSLKPSVVIRPGETIRWTLRAFNTSGGTDLFCTEYDETQGARASDCASKLTVTADAQAKNTDLTGSEENPETSTWPEVRSTFRILPPPLPFPDGAAGAPYGPVPFGATGGRPPYYWDSPNPPAGMTLSVAGELSGIPATVETSSFTVTVRDSSLPALEDTQTFVIRTAPLLQITTTTMSDAVVGFAYNHALTTDGGTGALTWSLASGSLPGGLTLNSEGVISGTPAAAGTSNFSVRVTDSASPPQSVTLALRIQTAVLLQITTGVNMPNGVVGVAYSQTLVASGGIGEPTWSLAGGSLPDGLTLSPSGVISGTPTTQGVFDFGVQARDSAVPAQTSWKGFQLVTALPLQITTAAPLPNALVGFAYTQPLTAGGGIGPYTWTMTSGSLPPGVLWASGAIGGIPTARIPGTFSVRVTDSAVPSQSATATFVVPMDPTPLTYVVSSTADSGPGSLRDAITNANANTLGFDTISFAIPSPPYTIAPVTQLPPLIEGAVVDGTTQPGYAPGNTPIVELRGNAGIMFGLQIVGTGNNSTVRGLAINGFGYGLYVGGGTNGVTIDRNYIGTDTSGTTGVPNRVSGISIYQAANTRVVGNLISGQGTIGSGSEVDGVYVGEVTTGTIIQNNLIGTNASGTAALGNAGFGVKISGGTSIPPPPNGTQVTDNVISGNELGGVVIQRGATGTVVANNKIGTGSDTAVAIGNLGSGVEITESPNNRIGGTDPNALSNTIANNGRYGIQVWGAGATGNYFMGNEIRNNGYIGIDQGGSIPDYGVTPNDVPDSDGILNFPIITSADAVGGTTHINASWSTTPSADVWVEIFTNTSCDFAGGNGEGAERFDYFSVSTDSAGHAGFARTVAKMPPHNVLTATVTMYNPGPTRTSEFSACYTIPAPTNPTILVAPYPAATPPAPVGITNFLISATVTPGTNPPSTGITATADLSSIGGSPTESINDLGMAHGCDDITGDGNYIGCGHVGNVTPGTYTIPVTITDAQGRSSSTSFPFTVLAAGSGALYATIHDATGAHLPGVAVTLTPASGGTPVFYSTDGGGMFLATLAAGTWNLNVGPAGYGTTQVQIVANTKLALDVYPQTASFGATVLDNSGAVLPTIPVTVTNVSTGASTVLTTDGAGRVSATLPAGVYYVTIIGYPPTRVNLLAGSVSHYVIQP